MNSGADLNTVLFWFSESGLSSCGVSLTDALQKKMIVLELSFNGPKTILWMDSSNSLLFSVVYSHTVPNAEMKLSKSATLTAPSLLRSYGQQSPAQP